jgi:hypothetical protein
MDTDPIPSIVHAIEQGRGRRGRPGANRWSHYRAQVLTAALAGRNQVRLAGLFGLGLTQLRDLISEACARLPNQSDWFPRPAHYDRAKAMEASRGLVSEPFGFPTTGE